MAYRLPEFDEYFLANWVSLPLKKGDAVFFNPALFHAAGANQTSDFERSANLIQVSSAFGKPMETIDSIPLVGRCWDMLSSRYKEEGMSDETDAFVKALVEGYPFPANLDKRPPAPGGMAPEMSLLKIAVLKAISDMVQCLVMIMTGVVTPCLMQGSPEYTGILRTFSTGQSSPECCEVHKIISQDNL
ncbi:hypothetical protein LTR28_013721 [Elasticomyces elasticus]|nr:hypothetical protein LTR28_013721 [Elasticomyces elasticus]